MTFLKYITVTFFVLFGWVGESRAVTLLASFEPGILTVTNFTRQVAVTGIRFEIGYESTTPGVFDGPVFASTTFNNPSVPAVVTTNSGAGFDALKLGIVDGIDDTILVAITILTFILPTQANPTGMPAEQTANTTFLESAWISGGATGLPGPDLTGFVVSELVANNPFSIFSTGTTTNVGFGSDYKLFGTPQLSVVPLPAALPLFAGGLGLFGYLGWRRKRRAAKTA